MRLYFISIKRYDIRGKKFIWRALKNSISVTVVTVTRFLAAEIWIMADCC